LLAREQRFVQVNRRDWLGAILLVEIIAIVLLLPSLALVGMEHTTQALLTALALVLFQHIVSGRDDRRQELALLATLLIAGLFRFEAVFLAVGIAAGLMAATASELVPRTRTQPLPLRRALRLGGTGVVAAATPFIAYGVVNLGFGLDFFPASIASKAARELNEDRISVFRTPAGALDALRSDNLLLMIFLGVLVYLVIALRDSRVRASAALAVAYAVLVTLHCFVADMGQLDRYQAYLLAAGVYVGLRILAEVVPTTVRPAIVLLLVIALPALAAVKVGVLWETPTATSNTYLQRYQVGRFLDKYYDGQPVATGELGYVTLFHDGPVTDILGIGDPEVLDEYQRHGEFLAPGFLERVASERDVQAVAAYSRSAAPSTPESWRFAGRWSLDEKAVTAFEPTLDFLAIDGDRRHRLSRYLDEDEPSLPTGASYVSLHEVLSALGESRRR
ncbi:MAG: hypothetical protein ACRDWD_11485, partial [Acidimicrobiia bacterium]